MTDSVYTFKVIVVGTILGCAIGQNYLFQNYRTPRRNNKFYVRQLLRQPRVIFADNNGLGFRVTQLPRGVFATRPRSGHPAFRPNPLGSLVGASSPRPPAKTGSQGLGTEPSLTTTYQDPQKLIDFLVNVIIQSQKRKTKGTSTSLSPVLPVVDGSHLMTYTLPKGPHLLQKHTLSEGSNIPTHTPFKGSQVPTHILSEGSHVPTHTLSEGSHIPTDTLSKGSHVPTHSLHTGSQLPPTKTLSEGSHMSTHIHPFQNLGSENSVSTVVVHSHRPGQIPHVHIVNLNASNSPLFSGIGYHRHNTIQTSVPNILQISLPNPLMLDFFDKLPHFLTGEKKKQVVTKAVNTTLLKPTNIPIVPVRLQILAPSQSTRPTRSLTKPASAPAETDKEDGDFEGAGEGPINPVTKISEPNSQIPSPRQEPALVPTTPVTVFPGTTPTATPTTNYGVLVSTPITATSVTPVTIPPMTTPVVPVTSPTTTIDPRTTVSPTTTPTTPTTTPATLTTTPTTPITEPIPPITNLKPNIYPIRL